MYKFKPILKSMLWGGDKIIPYKEVESDKKQVGESWEISGVKDNESVVAEGVDAGMKLPELIERDKAALLGRSNYERFGKEFPLLIKFIDARQDLSIQVHPNDKLAWERHQSKGKTEMWYVIHAEEGACIYAGFQEQLTPEAYARKVADGTILDSIAKHEVHSGDVFYLPAGRIHAIGKGVLLAEVQQTSDLTYRIYDWDRVDAEGKGRELHTALAIDAIDFEADADLLHRKYNLAMGGEAKVIESPYFTMVMHDVAGSKELDRSMLDSFIIYIAIKGDMTIVADGASESLKEGEVVLIPAEMNDIHIEGNGRIMEVYIGELNE